MSSADLEYCMKNLGDNWICYGGNFAEVRQYSNNVLCLTAASYNPVDKLIDVLSNNIGGNVGISRIGNEKLTDEEISACKIRGFEVMASYAYDKANIPTAIARGATMILSDNIGKDVHSILASSIGGWENFNYDGQIANGMLNLEIGQYISLPLTKKGNYKVFAQFDGEGICTLPSYDDRGNFIQQDFPMLSGTFVCPTLYIEDGETTMNIVAESAMSIKTLIVFYDAN